MEFLKKFNFVVPTVSGRLNVITSGHTITNHANRMITTIKRAGYTDILGRVPPKRLKPKHLSPKHLKCVQNKNV